MNDVGQHSGATDGARVSFWLRQFLGWLTGAVLFFMMILTAVDVIARFVFSNPLPGTFEIMEFSLAIVVFSAMPLVTWDQGHISVSLFEGLFQGTGRHIQQIFVMALSVIGMGIITVQMWGQGNQLDATGATTGFLLWPRAPIAYFISSFAGLSFLLLIGLFIGACAGKISSHYDSNQ